MNIKNLFVLGLAILLITSVATTSTINAADQEWVVARTYDLSVSGGDMVKANIGPTCVMQQHVNETLITWMPKTLANGSVQWQRVGILAESWEWVSGANPITFRIHLRKGIKFQNGAEFTAEDVKYTYDWIKAHPKDFMAQSNHELYECKVVDPYTIDMVCLTGNTLLDQPLCWTGIVPHTRGTTDAEIAAYTANPVGTGPYKIIEWKRDKPIRLERWDGYRTPFTGPKYLTIKFVPDVMTRMTGLMSGEFDIIDNLAFDHVQTLKNRPGIAVNVNKGGMMDFYEFQFLKAPFDNPLVRQAIILAVDRESMLKTIWRGNGTLMAGLQWQQGFGTNQALKPRPFDPTKAKQLLAQAGYSTGFTFEYSVTQGARPKDVERATAIQGYLKDVGITMNIKPIDYALGWQNFYTGKFTMMETTWGYVPYPTDQVLVWDFITGFPEKDISGGKVPSDVVQIRNLITQARAEPDLEKQRALFEKIDQLSYDSSIIMPFAQYDVYFAYNQRKMGQWTLTQVQNGQNCMFFNYPYKAQ